MRLCLYCWTASMYYINMREGYGTETVAEFATIKEAREMLPEYRMAYDWIKLWISTRSTKEWRETS